MSDIKEFAEAHALCEWAQMGRMYKIQVCHHKRHEIPVMCCDSICPRRTEFYLQEHGPDAVVVQPDLEKWAKSTYPDANVYTSIARSAAEEPDGSVIVVLPGDHDVPEMKDGQTVTAAGITDEDDCSVCRKLTPEERDKTACLNCGRGIPLKRS